jgi:hypothetical protein
VSVAARIKGAGLREFAKWFGEAHGAAIVRELFARLPPDARELFSADDPYLGVVSSVWYPAKAVHALCDQIEYFIRDAREAKMREGSHAAIRANLHGMYKWMFQTMMSPERYAKNAQKLFSRYYEPGEMVKRFDGPTAHITTVRGWTGHHPLMCDSMRYTADVVYGMMGCKDVTSRKTACVSTGAKECIFRISWRDDD